MNAREIPLICMVTTLPIFLAISDTDGLDGAAAPAELIAFSEVD
jgi:hypothetical protein